jgi:hypothetical protein
LYSAAGCSVRMMDRNVPTRVGGCDGGGWRWCGGRWWTNRVVVVVVAAADWDATDEAIDATWDDDVAYPGTVACACWYSWMRLLQVSMGWVAVVATPLAIALSTSCCQIGLRLFDATTAAAGVAVVAGVVVEADDDDDDDEDSDDDDNADVGSLTIALTYVRDAADVGIGAMLVVVSCLFVQLVVAGWWPPLVVGRRTGVVTTARARGTRCIIFLANWNWGYGVWMVCVCV